MKKFKCLLTAMLLGCSTMSFAQFMNGGGSSVSSSSSDVEAWKGLRFSYDRTFVNVDAKGADPEDYNGFSVGYVQSFQIAKQIPIFFETGLGLNFARYSTSDDFFGIGEDVDYSSTVLGLTIPLNFVYGIKINENLALKPYTGFYVRVNLMGKGKYSSDDDYIQEAIEDAEYDSQNYFDKDDMGGKDETWNRCQFGWQIGATLDINKFNVGIGYALDFNEIAEKTKLGIFSARVGYNF